MKQFEYIEGKEAAKNFEEGMKCLFKVPKDSVVPLMKKSQYAASRRKMKKKKSDKD